MLLATFVTPICPRGPDSRSHLFYCIFVSFIIDSATSVSSLVDSGFILA